jgi:hypothetical protein
VREIAARIAKHLQGWKPDGTDANPHFACLKHETGPECSLGLDHDKKRLHVRGSWPWDQRNGAAC